MSTNTKTALFFVLFLAIVAFMAYWLIGPGAVAKADNTFPMTTNFVCEMRGKLSNEHYDVSQANYSGNGEWTLTYRDTKSTTRYLQRRGEDCRTESFPTLKR